MRQTIKLSNYSLEFSNGSEGFDISVSNEDNKAYERLCFRPWGALCSFTEAVATYFYSNGFIETDLGELKKTRNALAAAVAKIDKELEYRAKVTK